MDIKAYIESGIIETCVLGIASEAEYREFQELCNQFPEIAEARKAFELSLEHQLMKEPLTPPSYLKEKIFQALTISGPKGLVDATKPEYQVPVRSINVWKYVTAACIVLLAGAMYWAYFINNKYQKLTRNSTTTNQSDHFSHTDAIIALNSFVVKPTVKWSIMAEPGNTSHCMAHIYWDSVSKNTFLLLGNIPKPLSDKQFQLWGILNDQPVNLGIFDIQKEGQLIQMENIPTAKLFYITIEPRGGSDTPNMKAQYAVGQL